MNKLVRKFLKFLGTEFADLHKDLPWYKQLWLYLYLENELVEWYLRNIWYRLKCWKENIQRILDWVPVLWQDRDWDFMFMFRIMKKKLERMERNMRKEAIIENSEKYADEMKVAINLLDRLVKNKYFENAMDPVEKKYGRLGEPQQTVEKDGSVIITYEMKESKNHKKARKARMDALTHSEYMEDQDVKYLFKYISKHYRKWWD